MEVQKLAGIESNSTARNDDDRDDRRSALQTYRLTQHGCAELGQVT